MWVTRKRFVGFEKILDQRTINLFLAWLVGCVFLTLSHVWRVGNTVHVSGLLFGMGVGAWLIFEPQRKLIATGLALLVFGSSLELFWAPWSFAWTSWRGERAYDTGDFKASIHWDQRSLELGQDKVWCWQSLALAYYCLDDKVHYLRIGEQRAGSNDLPARVAPFSHELVGSLTCFDPADDRLHLPDGRRPSPTEAVIDARRQEQARNPPFLATGEWSIDWGRQVDACPR